MIDPNRLDLGLEGKVAVVTGAARNIGRATALALSAAGVKVGLVAREDSDRLEAARADCAKNNPAHAVALDLGDPAALAAGVDEIESAIGPVDILINNAAIRPRTPLDEISLEEWDRVMAVNVRAPFLLTQRLLPGMQERRWGRIINVSGMDAYWGSVHRVHVTTSKLAVAGLTAALTAQVAKYGVTVNTVVPGAIDTERHSPGWYPDLTDLYENQYQRVPAARFGSPEEMANVMLFVSSQLSSYMTGQTFHVSGGYPIVRHRENELDPDVNWVGGPVSEFEKGRFPAP
jgi:3-oxoacyl-[acyl-carrier protein] reductase